MNLQILARQNLFPFLKMSEQIMYSPLQLLVRNSGHLLLLSAQNRKNTEQITYKIFAQNLYSRKFKLV